MITAGIDSGIENVKAVILKDGQVIARSIARSGGAHRADSAEQVWTEALTAAKLEPSAVSKVIATGQVRVVTLDSGDKIVELMMNQKCHAGLGLFLRSMARTLGMTVEEMCQISGKLPDNVAVNDSCCVFAELDAIALIHNNTPKPDIIQAVHEAVATRINAVLNDKVVPQKDTTVLFGGVAYNQGVINALKKRSGINFLIPEKPEFACALGAALIGAYQVEN